MFIDPLHSNTMVGHNIDKGEDGEYINNGGKHRVFTKEASGNCTTLLDRAFYVYILKGSLLGDNQSGLGQTGQTAWQTKDWLGD
jgi:hypothetical protein